VVKQNLQKRIERRPSERSKQITTCRRTNTKTDALHPEAQGATQVDGIQHFARRWGGGEESAQRDYEGLGRHLTQGEKGPCLPSSVG